MTFELVPIGDCAQDTARALWVQVFLLEAEEPDFGRFPFCTKPCKPGQNVVKSF